MKELILILIVIGSLGSCNNEVTQQLEPKGVALGVMNEIVVIADDDIWEGAVGDTFRYYFESAYPILPAPEPLFDLRHFTIQELEGQPLRKELRSYAILADLSDSDSETTRMVKRDMGSEKFNQALTSGTPISSVGKDKWSRGQLLIYLFGQNRKALSESIRKNFSATASRVNQHDEKQLKSSVYLDRTNIGLGKQIAQKYNIELQIPGEYQEAYRDDDLNILWLRKDTEKAILNVVIQKQVYSDPSQLSKENISAMRNEFGRNYVTSDLDGDYMVINDDDLPVYEYAVTIDGQYAKEIRGTWEMTVDFSAGPFITYVIINSKKNELIYLDVFVLAPGTDKRDMMMQLDYIIKNAKILGGAEVN